MRGSIDPQRGNAVSFPDSILSSHENEPENESLVTSLLSVASIPVLTLGPSLIAEQIATHSASSDGCGGGLGLGIH